MSETLVARLDGVILTGSRSNVQPRLYKGPPHPEGTPEDEQRDATTMRLIRAAIAAGIPVFAICRGLQELNVALGGSLHQRLQDLPGPHGPFDPAAPQRPHPHRQGARGPRHAGKLAASARRGRRHPGELAAQPGHRRLAPGLAVEGVAPDGTIEAVRLPGASALTIGVQWHPEYDFATDAVSRNLFAAFGAAVRNRTEDHLAAD